MPAYSLAVLSDGDVAKIYEYLATIPTARTLPQFHYLGALER